ncbi:hypothetical protein PV328_001297 [Microctonus aethiopoides]|uniref:Phosphatidylinositol-3-phosphatase SAC1 n=1 Tax=Microctonus aethiopoides TaxID=144406 RepID=A0AA39KXH0_9HYME|nr:hypothetical protein PV328_001297 [Microctonus aethiopoides]
MRDFLSQIFSDRDHPSLEYNADALGAHGELNETGIISIEDPVELPAVGAASEIPLFWQQKPNLKYQPKPHLYLNENHQIVCARHLDAQIFYCGKQILVNLIDHRGAEEILEKGFRSVVSQISAVESKY